MTAWICQQRESYRSRQRWHVEDRAASEAAELGLRATLCGAAISGGSDVEQTVNPPLEDRCPLCQESFRRALITSHDLSLIHI